MRIYHFVNKNKTLIIKKVVQAIFISQYVLKKARCFFSLSRISLLALSKILI